MKFRKQLAADLSYTMQQRKFYSVYKGLFFGRKSLKNSNLEIHSLVTQNWQDCNFSEPNNKIKTSVIFTGHET